LPDTDIQKFQRERNKIEALIERINELYGQLGN
jgi:trehalose-6-phosphate synthase